MGYDERTCLTSPKPLLIGEPKSFPRNLQSIGRKPTKKSLFALPITASNPDNFCGILTPRVSLYKLCCGVTGPRLHYLAGLKRYRLTLPSAQHTPLWKGQILRQCHSLHLCHVRYGSGLHLAIQYLE